MCREHTHSEVDSYLYGYGTRHSFSDSPLSPAWHRIAREYCITIGDRRWGYFQMVTRTLEDISSLPVLEFEYNSVVLSLYRPFVT